jgi:hypothetical protein
MTPAPDEATAETMIPLALAEHVDWLRRHGEDAPIATAWSIAERIDTAREPSGDVLFEVECEPVTDDELERWINRIGFARRDLLAAYEALPEPMRDWTPPADTVRHRDPWAEDPRSADGIVRHVLQLEVYYRHALRDGAAGGIFTDVADAANERAQTVDAMRAVAPMDRVRVFLPLRPGASEPERWTLHKVVRRIISHERAHTAELAERRTWAYLGVPRP